MPVQHYEASNVVMVRFIISLCPGLFMEAERVCGLFIIIFKVKTMLPVEANKILFVFGSNVK